MAGASMNDIKSRMKSVRSTMQITKAMELVATSKLRRAKEKAESSRPYYDMLGKTVKSIAAALDGGASPYFTEREGKTLFIVIAGDRGLAGGYNANIFRTAEALSKNADAIYLPVGKKALEYYKHRNKELLTDEFSLASEVGVGAAMRMGAAVAEAFTAGRFTKVTLVFTKFISMISQLPVYEELLPFSREDGEKVDPLIEEDLEEALTKLVPNYIGGIIYAAVSESGAAEQGARRSAMNSANKNAEEMIGTLMLKYNRARQAVITQEITEIVSGSEAL